MIIKDPLLLIVLVVVAALLLTRKRLVAGDPIVEVAYHVERLPTGAPSVQPASTLIGGHGAEPFDLDTRGSHYLGQFSRLRKD